jgi:hypothetical protein
MVGVIMPKKITITVNGQPRELTADYLSEASLEYWHAWLANAARMAHNPFIEFAAKVEALPEDLQNVATREFMAGLNFDNVPKVVLLDTLSSMSAVKILCVLATREDVITDENYSEAFPLLFPFIHRQEILANSIQEANRLRAEVGKPPIGQPANGQPLLGG